jgi:hypothetical protein
MDFDETGLSILLLSLVAGLVCHCNRSTIPFPSHIHICASGIFHSGRCVHSLSYCTHCSLSLLLAVAVLQASYSTHCSLLFLLAVPALQPPSISLQFCRKWMLGVFLGCMLWLHKLQKAVKMAVWILWVSFCSNPRAVV